MQAVLVTHTHWDREWYRTFQDFRARLVDLVDGVLDLCAADPGYRFLLDGQTIVLEDYLEIRPDREPELRQRCAEGRIALGPWYVQPDSLMPSGEAHVRNLLLGRLVGERIGPVSRVGYTPDSFGHPGQLPQILAGMGIGSFLYWRGNGSEIRELPSEYAWEAPDGSRVLACHLGNGYFNAGTPPGVDLEKAGAKIAERAAALAERSPAGAVLLLNGIDHAIPEARTGELAKAIAAAGGFEVRRGLLEDFLALVSDVPGERPVFRGELVGGCVANLLPGVWSTRTWIKLESRAGEAALEGWAEPFAALGRLHGLPDERPALRLGWKGLLQNQAHDSICGCSRDEVHEQMRARFDAARELADRTAARCLERLAGLGAGRRPPFSLEFDAAVASPSPRRRTDIVRLPLDFHPYSVPHADPRKAIHPTVLRDLARMRFTVDGEPARLVPAETGRVKLIPQRRVFDLEFVARDVPALGLRRVRIRGEEVGDADAASGTAPGGDEVETAEPGTDGACIEAGRVAVSVRPGGVFDVRFGDAVFEGLGELESVGDRGDTYDFDPVVEGPGMELEWVDVVRRRHPSGIQELAIRRDLRMPARLAPSRRERAAEPARLEVETTLRVAPGVERVDLEVRVDNRAEDHRLRMRFPVPPVERFEAAGTFDVVGRTPGPRGDAGWIHPAPATFPHQGFVHAGGLSVVAPGLVEAEVERGARSAVVLTLLRCVGSLSAQDLDSRPGLAGPGTATPGAQCPGVLRARLALLPGLDPAAAREAELGLRAVPAGADPLLAGGEDQLAVEPPGVLLSALKPAEDGQGVVLRLLNPGDDTVEARVALGFDFREARAVRLDETPEAPAGPDPVRDGRGLRMALPPRSLRSLRIV